MKQSRSALQNLYGAAGVIFPDNTTREISEEDERDFGQDVTDSDFNLIDDKLTGAQGVFPDVTDEASLKTVGTVGVAVGSHLIYRDTGAGNVLRVYELVAGVTAESSPDVIRPDDYAGGTNEKVWLLAGGTSSGGLDQVEADTTGGTITLDFADKAERAFYGSDPIGAAKIWALGNDASALVLRNFIFIISGLFAQTMPANFKMVNFDANWNSGTQEWTPQDAGKYKAIADYDSLGDEWLLTITGPFNDVT